MLEILRKSGDEILRIGIVLIMMLTTVMPVEVRWMECEPWIFFGIPALFVFGFTMIIWNKQKFDCTLTDIMVSVWFAYYVCRAWIGNEWPCQIEFLKVAGLFLLYVGLRIAFHGTNMSVWVLIGSILVFGCYEVYLGFSQMYGNDVSRHNLFALTGNFLNPGPYSAYLMIGVVVGLSALKNMQNQPIVKDVPNIQSVKKISERILENVNGLVRNVKNITWRHIVTIAVIIMAIMLPATMSRAAFLGVAVVVLLIYRDKYWKYRYILWGTIVLAGVAFYFFKQGSADGRIIIWKAALTTWIDTPWLGVGIGGFQNAFADGVAALSSTNIDFSSANPPDGAYNIFVKIIVEQGIVGVIFAISLTIVVLIKLSRNGSALFWGMVALLVFSMFSYPFDLLPYKVIAVLIVAWSESKGERQKTNDQRRKTIGWIKVLFLSGFLGFASWQAGKIVSRCFKIEKNLGMAYSFSDFYSVGEGFEWMTFEGDNREFLFAFGKKLREEGRYNESNAVLRQGTMCSADPMFYVLIGNNYKDMKHYDLAEKSYYKAFSVMPNRLYPYHQLMLLYKDWGDMKKAKAMARRVVDMKPKVDSRLTRDIKKKAADFLREN